MKTSLLSSVALTILAFAVPAAAADLPARVYTKAPVVSAVYNWTGFYVGAHVGYAWGEENDNLSEVLPVPGDQFDVDGVVGGVHVGFNWQASSVVFGFEGDFDGSGVKGDFDFDEFTSGTLSMKSHWQASFRGRLGIAANDWLVYGTGGIAFAKVKAAADYNCDGTCFFEDEATLIGWTAGVGVEKAFSPNWIGRVEVRYTDFGSENVTVSINGEESRVKFKETSVTAGISYKF